jgi:hypothetical protein
MTSNLIERFRRWRILRSHRKQLREMFKTISWILKNGDRIHILRLAQTLKFGKGELMQRLGIAIERNVDTILIYRLNTPLVDEDLEACLRQSN